MHYSIANTATVLLGLLAQVTTATSCTSSNAYPVEDYIASGSGGGSSGAEAFLSYDIIGSAVSNAVKKRNPSIPANRTPDAKLANIAYAVRDQPHRRADDKGVTCSALETCLSVQKTPFCLDLTSGEFHDGVGTTGNAVTGDYVLGDGRKGNLYKGPHPLPDEGEAKVTSALGGNGNGASPTQTGQAAPKPTGNGVGGREGSVGGLVIGGLVAVVGLL